MRPLFLYFETDIDFVILLRFMDIPTTTHNDLFELAEGFINNSNQPVFLTGKAGTGKTTFLKHIIKHSVKNCAVVAPTGVAAINAGGATIHSFFQLPFTPYLPQGAFEQHTLATNEPHNLMASMRLSQKRREVLQQLELLIIDEISMVRADVLDAMDNVLRHGRSSRRQAFGGVQVLYIGDLYQLPPVVKDEEWILLKNFYENPFFFSSKVMAEQPPVYIELKKVYRQHDSHFIQILNQVRNNDMDEEGYNLLHERLNKRPANEGVITLTTHNATADQLNNSALGLIKDKEFVYRANVDGDFSERIFPTEEYLRLKKGTQVMFLKNNTEKGYYNGKIGTISNLEEDKIVVNCKDADGEKEIEVQKETWRNVKYTVDEKKSKIEEEVAGSFTQYPLRLAWAITIHKSQGLTFNQVIIDAQRAFAPGQVYVALSRCRTLEGIYLQSAIAHKSLRSDDRIVAYCQQQSASDELRKSLAQATCNFQQEIILALMNFSDMAYHSKKLSDFIIQQPSFGKKSIEWAAHNVMQAEIYKKHGNTFSAELQKLFGEMPPKQNEAVTKRLTTASKWFINELENLKEHLRTIKASTDNRQVALDFNSRAGKLYEAICNKMFLLTACTQTFDLNYFQKHKASYKAVPFPVSIYAAATEKLSGMADLNLLNQLRNLRSQMAEDAGIALFMICSTESLELMATYFPFTEKDLEKIKGFGTKKISQYGNPFLETIRDYCNFFAIETQMHLIGGTKKKKTPKATKNDTKLLTFDLYQQGKTIQEIATLRNLSTSTIESHLAYYIQSGSIAILDILDVQTYRDIKAQVQKNPAAALAEIKTQLRQYSYGQIKMVMAAKESN